MVKEFNIKKFKIEERKKFLKSLEDIFLEIISKEKYIFKKKRVLFFHLYRLLNNFSVKDQKIIMEIAEKFLKKINSREI